MKRFFLLLLILSLCFLLSSCRKITTEEYDDIDEQLSIVEWYITDPSFYYEFHTKQEAVDAVTELRNLIDKLY